MLLAAGLAVVVAAAELLVRSATRLADILHIQPLLIGLTVVAFGTSAPEVSVSVTAARSGATAMAVGNVVGSNIFNVLMVLGVAALVAPLACSRRVVRREVPVMVTASALALAIGLSGRIDRAVGAGLLALGVIYVGWLVHAERREHAARAREQPAEPAKQRAAGTVLSVAMQLLLIAGGLVGLVAGARWMVASASRIAGRLGVSDLLVGLTVIAAGTSLPELATSVVASRRGARDLAVGNVVGSNIFNCLSCSGQARSPGSAHCRSA